MQSKRARRRPTVFLIGGAVILPLLTGLSCASGGRERPPSGEGDRGKFGAGASGAGARRYALGGSLTAHQAEYVVEDFKPTERFEPNATNAFAVREKDGVPMAAAYRVTDGKGKGKASSLDGAAPLFVMNPLREAARVLVRTTTKEKARLPDASNLSGLKARRAYPVRSDRISEIPPKNLRVFLRGAGLDGAIVKPEVYGKVTDKTTGKSRILTRLPDLPGGGDPDLERIYGTQPNIEVYDRERPVDKVTGDPVRVLAARGMEFAMKKVGKGTENKLSARFENTTGASQEVEMEVTVSDADGFTPTENEGGVKRRSFTSRGKSFDVSYLITVPPSPVRGFVLGIARRNEVGRVQATATVLIFPDPELVKSIALAAKFLRVLGGILPGIAFVEPEEFKSDILTLLADWALNHDGRNGMSDEEAFAHARNAAVKRDSDDGVIRPYEIKLLLGDIGVPEEGVQIDGPGFINPTYARWELPAVILEEFEEDPEVGLEGDGIRKVMDAVKEKALEYDADGSGTLNEAERARLKEAADKIREKLND